ncbi:MAG TPA: SIR2 family protein [Phycisphaerae bacterium]|nr:SIR2 family protein [Phycisphaerae bacterium]
MWDCIRDRIELSERAAIEAKLDDGAEGIEQALDLLDRGGVEDSPHRHSVAAGIADYFATLAPPLDKHGDFMARIARRTESAIPVFCLNYDSLLERAAERSRVRLVDGFIGVEEAYFDPAVFQERTGTVQRGRRYAQVRWVSGVIHLLKLHGSVGWYECPSRGIRKCSYTGSIPADTKRLMVPPQYRKAMDTTLPPYAALWSEFRRLLRHGPSPIHRLVCIGYGMRDEHVNAVIENGLARSDLTVMIFSRDLATEVFDRWSSRQNVIIVTRDRCSLSGETGPGQADLWSFGRLSTEV